MKNLKRILLNCIPGRAISRCVGVIALLPIPKVMRLPIFGLFSKLYGVRSVEVELPLSSYGTFDAFFTRNLKSGSRPIKSDRFISPVDGFLLEAGQIKDGKLLQAKGIFYTVAALTRDGELAARFLDGVYYTFYLAPGDYHHIHAAVPGDLVSRRYIPGALHPVNSIAVSNIPSLYAVNERISLLTRNQFGLSLSVLVGAMNVGSISLDHEADFDQKNAFLRAGSQTLHNHYNPARQIRIGSRLGTFHLGSTVVLLFSREYANSLSLKPSKYVGTRVFWGQALC